MSKADNLKDFLVDLANAIREKKNKTGAINPQDFSAEILSIIAGDVQMPNVSGTLVITEGITEDDYEALKLVLGSNITIDAQGGIYIHFEDPEVLRVLLAKITPNDGSGITTAQAEAVTSINTWFQNNTVIETFGEFEKFTGITYVSPKNDSGYGDSAFRMCTSLREITIPNNVTRIGSFCFEGCSVLAKVNFVDNLNITAINNGAFTNCSSLELDINFPNLTELTGYNTFCKCAKIEKISSLGNITQINGAPNAGYSVSMFLGCTSLKEVNLPQMIISIGAKSFYGCLSLNVINFPNALKEIKEQAFYNCTSLEIDELNLPNLETLGKDAFYGVKIKKLLLGKEGGTLTLPTAATYTQNYGDKSVLEEAVLPRTVTSIPNGSFFKYTQCVIEDLNLPNLTSLGGGAFNGTKLRKITSLGEVTRLPGNANNTGGVFEACIELRQIQQSVLDKLEYIATAFQGCVNLEIEDLRLPNLTEISAGFANCNKIRRVMDLGHITRFFGETELSPDTNPFGTTVELIVLPESVESIGRQAFRNTGNSLKTVILKATTPPSCALYWDNSMPTTLTFYVPDASVEAYKTATNWSQYSVRIKPLSEYEG